MGSNPAFRNYLYVSQRKVGRLSAALPRGALRRLSGLDVKVGPFGAGVKLDSDVDADVIAAVPPIEKAIEKEFGVRTIADPDIRVGHWIRGVGVAMTYGVVEVMNVPSRSVAFVAVQDAQTILLAGSASYLLDRDVPKAEVGGQSSAPHAIRALLQNAAQDEGQDFNGLGGVWSGATEAIFRSLMHEGGLHPLSFLAQVTGIVDRPGMRHLAGTPLYVAASQPW